MTNGQNILLNRLPNSSNLVSKRIYPDAIKVDSLQFDLYWGLLNKVRNLDIVYNLESNEVNVVAFETMLERF